MAHSFHRVHFRREAGPESARVTHAISAGTRQTDLTLHRRGSGVVIHGEEPSKSNWDCTICRSCRLTTSDSIVPK